MGVPRKPFEPPTPEQRAFLEQAIEQYGKATYNFAYRLTHNEADARDLTQEAFIRVYRAWRSFQPGTSFLSWVYRIVTNLYRDELRRKKGRYQEEIPEDNAPQEYGGDRPLAVTPIEDYVEGHQRTARAFAGPTLTRSTPSDRAGGHRGVQLSGDRGDYGVFHRNGPLPAPPRASVATPITTETTTTMMQHLTSETLIDYMHGALSPQEDAAAFAHLETCETCRKEYDAEAALTEMLRAHAVREEREMPAMLKAEIWSRIRDEQPSPWSRLAGWFRPAVAIPAAAAIALAAYFGTAYLGPHGAPSIAASYYLRDHAALNGTMPFNDRSSMSPADLESAAAVNTQETAVVVVPASYTADANP